MNNEFYEDDMKSLFEVIEKAVVKYSGEASTLNGAIGMLFTGYYYGWRHLYVSHSKKTVKKYENILGIKFTEFFNQLGIYSYRSAGLNEAIQHSNFWKVVSGETKIPHRGEIMTDEQAKRYVLKQPNEWLQGNLY